MTWVKLDDQFFANPKVLELSKDAKLLYLGALTHCAAQLTDGYVSPAALRLVCALVDVRPDHAEALTDAGLWRVKGDGYDVHDFLEYNMSARQVKAKRKANAERQARYRDRQSERDNEDTNGVSNAVTNKEVTASVTPPPSQSPSHTHKRQEQPKDGERANAPPPEQPFGIVLAFLDILETPSDDVPARWQSRQRGAAKNMLAEGYSAADILGCAAYMHSQTWRTNPFDLTDVHSQIGGWIAHGRPEYERPNRKQSNSDITRNAVRDFIARNSEQSGGDHRFSVDANGHGPEQRRPERLGPGHLAVPDGGPGSDGG